MIKLGRKGRKLFETYVDKLGISDEDAEKIIKKNKAASIFLLGESGLRMRSDEKNLSILMRTTIFRAFDDFEPLREEEKLKIKKYYGFDIRRILCKKNFIEDCINGDALLEDINDYIKEFYDCKKPGSINAYLGMTIREYNLWCENNDILLLRHIVNCHVKKIDIDDVLNDFDNIKMVARARSVKEVKQVREVANRYAKKA